MKQTDLEIVEELEIELLLCAVAVQILWVVLKKVFVYTGAAIRGWKKMTFAKCPQPCRRVKEKMKT